MHGDIAPDTLKTALIVLAAAGVVIPLFHRLRVSPVLGFMVVGLVVGPYGLGRFAGTLPVLGIITVDPHAIEAVAELGVVLLLFMIGLELSFERLWSMRRLVFGLGAVQTIGSAAILGAIAAILGYGHAGGAVLGLAWAMSSTAVVIQVLAQERRVGTAVGRTSFGILLFQDLLVVPVLFGVAAVAPHATADAGMSAPALGVAIVRALLELGAVVALGRIGMRALFRSVARTDSPELFMAACLLVVIASAMSAAAAGLSTALGALIGGLLLAGTEYRRQVEVTIEPFKGLFLGVFLISVGMSFDPARLLAFPGTVLAAGLGLVAVKVAVALPAALAFGLPLGTSLQAALLLAPAGEFSFVILAVAVTHGLLAQGTAQTALLVTALTMAVIPALSSLGRMLASRLLPRAVIDPSLLPPPELEAGAPEEGGPEGGGEEGGAPVLLAGFGRVGQTVAAMLEAHAIAYVALDRDADRVARQRRAGRAVYFGDMTQTALLHRIGLATARALVVTLDDPRAADAVVTAARAERPDLLIIARARDAVHAARLYRLGASDAVPETIEASLQLSEAVLVDVGVPMGPVIASIHEKRAEIQAQIKADAPGARIRALGRRRLRDAARAP